MRTYPVPNLEEIIGQVDDEFDSIESEETMPPEFKVILTKRIVPGHDRSGVTLTHTIQLPFVPFIGLEITDGGVEAHVIACWWDVDRSEFQCPTRLNSTVRDAFYQGTEPPCGFDELLVQYVERGWTRI